MQNLVPRRWLTFSTPVLGVLLLAHSLAAQVASPPKYPKLPSETPATFEQKTTDFDYTRRDVMIAMRDGVKLHTVILLPKGAAGAPILLTRTPYNATERVIPTARILARSSPATTTPPT